MEPKPPLDAEILPSTGAMPLTVQYTRRTLRMVTLSEMELDAVASLGNSVNLAFFGISAGALVAFGVVLSTVNIPDARHYAMFVSLTGLSGLAALYFGIRAIADYFSARRRLMEIKSGLS